MLEELASYRHSIDHIHANWSAFLEKRTERLAQQERHGVAAEKVAENIVEDLFTSVLDWTLADVNNQVGYADLLLTRLGIKYLLIEVKRPGALAWNRRAVDTALSQALRYADEQKVKCVGVSDGVMLYAADVEHGGLRDRAFASLASPEPQDSLWWLSVHGVYRPAETNEGAAFRLLPHCADDSKASNDAGRLSSLDSSNSRAGASGELLHHKYRLPCRCFAYIGHAADPRSWKLPYLLADGSADVKRLPKAIQAILSNYRGARVSEIPESAIPDVLVRLACCASTLGRMPHQSGNTAAVYHQLAEALDQLGRLPDVTNEARDQ